MLATLLKKLGKQKNNSSSSEEENDLLTGSLVTEEKPPQLHDLQLDFQLRLTQNADQLIIDIDTEKCKTEAFLRQLKAPYFASLRQKIITQIGQNNSISQKEYNPERLQQMRKFNSMISKESQQLSVLSSVLPESDKPDMRINNHRSYR